MELSTTLSQKIFRQTVSWVVVCVLLIGLDSWVSLDGVTAPAQVVLVGMQQRAGKMINWVQTPFMWVGYAQDGLDRIADLERRLNDVVVDKDRLAELEEQVESMQLTGEMYLREEIEPVVMTEMILGVEEVYVDAGQMHGVEEGMLVTDVSGILVGRVEQVGRYVSQVQTPGDQDARLPVRVVGSNAAGMLLGSGGQVELRDVLQEEGVRVGDILETSGKDGVLPVGLVVGQVTELTGDAADVTQTARVALLADMDHLVAVY